MQSSFSFRAILGSLLVWGVNACSATAQQTNSELHEVRGKVLNSVTGDPVAGALVQIAFPAQKAQFTNGDGTFVFIDVPQGSYSPVARKPGFFNETEPRSPTPQKLVPNAESEQIILKLSPEAIISGEVKNENGQPLEGLTVRAQRWQVENGQRQLVSVGKGLTNDEGNFRLADLRPGRYYLSFPSTNNGSSSTSYQLRSKNQVEEGYGSQFYPGVPDLESASVIEIRAGAHIHIVQTLSREHLFEIAGVVRGADPEKSFDLMLMNTAGDAVQKDVHINPKTGQFQIPGIPAGVYLLRATASLRTALRNTASGLLGLGDEEGPPLTATLSLHVHGDLSGLVVVLGTGASIGVQVRDEISDRTANNPHQVFFEMTPHDFPGFSSAIRIPPAPGDRRAATRFEGLAPDTYTLNGRTLGPWYISSLRCGGEDLLRDDLTIASGATLPPIEVTLRDDGAQLTVKVMEYGQSAVAGILLFSREYPKRSQFFGSASSISTGNLAPGTYYVIAMRGAEHVEFRNLAVMERYLTRATEVALEPRAHVTVAAEVQPPEE